MSWLASTLTTLVAAESGKMCFEKNDSLLLILKTGQWLTFTNKPLYWYHIKESSELVLVVLELSQVVTKLVIALAI